MVSTGLAALVRWLVPWALTPAPYLGFYPAKVVSAALGGVGPGLISTFGSLFLVNFVFGRFKINDTGAMLRQVIWVVASIGVSLLAGVQRQSRMRAQQHVEELGCLNDELEARVEQRTIEIREANLRLQEQLDAINQADALRQKNEELTRLNRSMVGRELRMIELKEEVNPYVPRPACRRDTRSMTEDEGFTMTSVERRR